MARSPVALLDGVISHLAHLADNRAIDYRFIVVFSTWLQTAFEVYILRRQLPCYDRPAPPPALKAHLEGDTFRKAQSYSRDKTRFQLLQLVFNQILGWIMIKSGAYSRLWDVAGRFTNLFGLGPNWIIVRSLAWITILTLSIAIPGLPWSYYQTFVLEEKHGFNKSTRALWVTDTLKSYVLVALLGLPVLAGFLKIIELSGKSFVPWLMLFLVCVQLTLQVIYPTFIQPLFNKLAPLPEGELRTKVEALANQLGFPLKHLYVIDGSKRSSHSNAYFYGLPWSKHIVIYDTLIKDSTTDEVVAVLGHELGHWYHSHPTKLLFGTQIHLFLTLLVFSVFINNQSLYAAFGFNPELATAAPQPFCIGFILFQLVLEPTDAFVKFLMHAQTRKYEYQADEFAVNLGKKPDLASALIKLHVTNLSSPHSDWLYSMYHHSHPTLPERLSAMDRFESNKGKVEGKKDL
ncbi:STE24 endopeptidase [Cryptococcus neoformans Tu259-1]|uniref:CAAX prenyl protease n=1 Tax=Cryptococcus neoformans Tu259-1 TaxID=1230072 RepID=A0A854QLJ2_CRYNE|nr:STE24 endopeptidase [Cryptococcus neoformans var. grubii Tu259-1]